MSKLDVLLGQWIALLVATTGIINQKLQLDYGVHVPIFQNWMVYVLLAFCYGITKPWWNDRKVSESSLELPLTDLQIEVSRNTKPKETILASIAFCDVQGNILAVLAYRYTSVASVMLLDCISIPTVMLLSYLIFGTQYSWLQFGAVITCLLGTALVIYADHDASSNSLFGDVLAMSGAVAYAISNVTQEHMVKTFDRKMFLFKLGIFGSIFAGVEFFMFEFHTCNFDGVYLIVLYIFVLFVLYNAISHYLVSCDATLLNLSLLTSDIWAVLAGVFIFDNSFSSVYGLGFVAVISGILAFVKSERDIEAE